MKTDKSDIEYFKENYCGNELAEYYFKEGLNHARKESEKEIEKLNEMLTQKVGKNAMDYICQGLNIHYQDRYEKLKEELRLEREVVDFYAKKENWLCTMTSEFEIIDESDLYKTNGGDMVGGKLARARIKERLP